MNKLATTIFLSLLLSFNVHGQTATSDYISPSEYIDLGQFDALFDSIPSAMDEYSKNQSIATFNTFLGRSDLNTLLMNLPSSQSCTTDNAIQQAGSDWMLDYAKDARVVMFNESHLTPASRTFVFSHLDELKQQGFSHIGFEALPDIINGDNPETAITTGYYTIAPMFSALIREAADLGFVIFGYENTEHPQGSADEQRHLREVYQSQNIIKVINSAPAESKFIIFGGWSHIAEEPLPDSAPSGKFRWMASIFKEESGIDPLTVDLTRCFYESDDAEEWKGQVFITDNGSALIQGQYTGAVDAQIYLPAPIIGASDAVSFYRRALGDAFPIPDALRSDNFAVLVQARLAQSDKSTIAYDRVLLQPGEDFPLYLKSGEYEITSYKGSGDVFGNQVVHIE